MVAESTCTPLPPVTSQPASGQQKAFNEHLKPSKEPELVLIAELTSRQEIKLRIKQNDDIPGAKVCLHAVCFLHIHSCQFGHYLVSCKLFKCTAMA